MKRSHLVIVVAIVGIIGVFVFRPRRSDLPVATGSVEGRASASAKAAADKSARPPSSLSAEPEGPITATARIVRGDNSVVETKSLDGEFARILVEPNEVLTIRLALSGMDPNREVRIDADNGGSLNRKLGPLTLTADSGAQPVEFQYAVGKHRGRYTLFITQGQRQEFMDFWVGPEPPIGQSGPIRIFNPDVPTNGRS